MSVIFWGCYVYCCSSVGRSHIRSVSFGVILLCCHDHLILGGLSGLFFDCLLRLLGIYGSTLLGILQCGTLPFLFINRLVRVACLRLLVRYQAPIVRVIFLGGKPYLIPRRVITCAVNWDLCCSFNHFLDLRKLFQLLLPFFGSFACFLPLALLLTSFLCCCILSGVEWLDGFVAKCELLFKEFRLSAVLFILYIIRCQRGECVA